mmetsp:Transcript_15628/g.22955  ORF Transcript_15628/g.22955 Transcript_15628/m.22955 type:complete len:329 (-) Transcript_15628:411-1397(-)
MPSSDMNATKCNLNSFVEQSHLGVYHKLYFVVNQVPSTPGLFYYSTLPLVGFSMRMDAWSLRALWPKNMVTMARGRRMVRQWAMVRRSQYTPNRARMAPRQPWNPTATIKEAPPDGSVVRLAPARCSPPRSTSCRAPTPRVNRADTTLAGLASGWRKVCCISGSGARATSESCSSAREYRGHSRTFSAMTVRCRLPRGTSWASVTTPSPASRKTSYSPERCWKLSLSSATLRWAATRDPPTVWSRSRPSSSSSSSSSPAPRRGWATKNVSTPDSTWWKRTKAWCGTSAGAWAAAGEEEAGAAEATWNWRCTQWPSRPLAETPDGSWPW